MKKIILLTLISVVLLCSCENMYENQQKYEGEVVYPGKFDTIVGHIGFERVEIDLMRAGRIPSSQMHLGKAKKTKVVYDDKEIIIDSLTSYVNVTGLTQSRPYNFKVYAIDEHGNESVPKEISLIPYTKSDLINLAISPPRIKIFPSSAIVEWKGSLSSILMDFYGFKYSYVNKEGKKISGERVANTSFFVTKIEAGRQVDVSVDYKVIPRVNRISIIDTVTFTDVVTFEMPKQSAYFTPDEKDVLLANGITDFSTTAVSDINKLIYPIHANSLLDIMYFSNLETLDLTGGKLFKLPSLLYVKGSLHEVVGGGDYAPCLRKAGDISIGNQQMLKELLESETLKKVYYRPNSMGLDDVLAPFVKTGVVELIEGPKSVLLDNQFYLDSRVQSSYFHVDIEFPANDAPSGEGLENIYKVTCKKKSSSIIFALPAEYQFNVEDYKYLKFKVYTPSKNSLSGEYSKFQRLWPRYMNCLWNYRGNSNFGQELWNDKKFNIPDEDLQKWTDIILDLSELKGKHSRVIILNIGGEPGINPSSDIIYYFANFRFEKE
ncbi:MAG: DUF4998 domain-containing protein [Bacteroidales bacterium]